MKTRNQKMKMKKSNTKTFKSKENKGNKRTNKNRSGGTTHNKTIQLKKLNCSPKPKGEINHFTCYTNKSLYKLRDLWNARHPDVKIKSNSPKEIHHLISEYLKGVCNKESCWIKQKAEFGPIESDMAEEKSK